MNDIILNEVEYAKKLIASEEMTDKPFKDISILARYYAQIEHLDNDVIEDKLHNYLNKHYVKYLPNKWTNAIQYQIKQANKYPLAQIDHISITEKELAVISSLENIRYERVLFTLLCFAKLYNVKNPKNNNWTNADIKEIFRLARVTITKYAQDMMIYNLKEQGFISLSKKIANLNLQMNFVDDDSPTVLKISDFRELGYEYMLWKGNKYIRCAECGRLMKQSANHRNKYCKDCAARINVDKTKYRMQKLRKTS